MRIRQIDRNIAEPEAKKKERPVTLKDVKVKPGDLYLKDNTESQHSGLSEADLISMIREVQIGE